MQKIQSQYHSVLPEVRERAGRMRDGDVLDNIDWENWGDIDMVGVAGMQAEQFGFAGKSRTKPAKRAKQAQHSSKFGG